MLPTLLTIFIVSLISLFYFSYARNEGIVSIQLSEATVKEEINLNTCIVFVQKPESKILKESEDFYNWYRTFLPVTSSTMDQQQRIVYSYRNVQSNFGKGVIIGVLDTEITPDHPSFSNEGMPPPPEKWKDQDGHGTHTASIVAGNFVQGASVFGNANGTAVGMAPLAHLAIYKVCGETCVDSDILAAMDAAVEDGVDLISISIGGVSTPFYKDAIAVGAFGAIQNGILVSCSAGNGGPSNSTLSNEAPWFLTVGASTMDRKIIASVRLGNNYLLPGESLFQPKNIRSTLLPIVYAGANGNASSRLCAPGSLRDIDVKGKIVLCEIGEIPRIGKGQEVKDAGGAAMILMNDELNGFSTFYGLKDNSQVTSFFSRGPSSLASPGILKPDIIEPGVSILAAWPVSVENKTNTISNFNVSSGTSISCPHLSGVTALLKSSHPDWSPAAIKSAIMTTADILTLDGQPILDETWSPSNLFAIGAGHVNLSKANDPGLVYDIQPGDYIPYLCGLGSISCTYTRTVTNVGPPNSSYTLKIAAPPGVDVSETTDKIVFSVVNQKATFSVTFRLSWQTDMPFVQGYLYWNSALHFVRSPIVVKYE
ncbi:hypothetical protein REPUB_Repub08aG0192300 [Reevesia pubescens]